MNKYTPYLLFRNLGYVEYLLDSLVLGWKR